MELLYPTDATPRFYHSHSWEINEICSLFSLWLVLTYQFIYLRLKSSILCTFQLNSFYLVRQKRGPRNCRRRSRCRQIYRSRNFRHRENTERGYRIRHIIQKYENRAEYNEFTDTATSRVNRRIRISSWKKASPGSTITF